MASPQRSPASSDILATWQEAYLAEAAAWRALDELQALRRLMHGRRKFQGFGEQFGAAGAADTSCAELAAASPAPLHRVAGGSGAASRTPPCCPRCGERLQGVGRFDPERMEVTAAADGLLEWRWRERRAA